MTTYYVKSSGSNGNTGLSDAQAWATPDYAVSQLSGTSSAHKILLKCGDSFKRPSGTSTLTVNYAGTSKANLAVLGAYYMDGGTEVEGVSGSRPKVYGDFAGDWTPNATVVAGDYYSMQKHSYNTGNGFWYQALNSGTFGATPPTWPQVNGATVVSGTVTLQAFGYLNQNNLPQHYGSLIGPGASSEFFALKDIRISNWRGYGTRQRTNSANVFPWKYSEIRNCAYDVIAGRCWDIGNINNNDPEYIIDGNIFTNCGKGGHDANWGTFSSLGGVNRTACWAVGGHGSSTSVTRIVSNNIGTGNFGEGIINSAYVKCFGNVFHAQRGPLLYFIAGQAGGVAYDVYENELYNNIFLGTTDSTYWRYSNGFTGWSIGSTNESAGVGNIRNNKIHHNLCAFTRYALSIGSPSVGPSSTFRDCDFVFNTCIDNQTPFVVFGGDQGGTGSNIKNNIFYNYTAGLSNMDSTTYGSKKINLDYNLWNSPTMAGGAAGANDVYGDPLLNKTTGWTSIGAYTDVAAADFRITTGSPAIGAGLDISGYTEDFGGNALGSPPSIGAWEAPGSTPPGGGGGTSTVPTVYIADNRYNQQSAGTGRTISAPGNLEIGNLIVLVFGTKNSFDSSNTNITNVSGSFTTAISHRSTTNEFRPEVVVMWREATAADIGAVYTFDATVDTGVVSLRIDGHKIGDPIGSTSGADTDGNNVETLDVTGITTAATNSYVMDILSTRGSSAITGITVSGHDSLFYYTGFASARNVVGFGLLHTSAEATGTVTFNWTGTTRASAVLVEIKAGTSSVDIIPPVWTSGPAVTTKTDTSATVSATLTDATTTDIKWYSVATALYRPVPSAANVIAGVDGGGLTAMASASKLTISSGTPETLTLSSLTDPKVRVSSVAKDAAASPNTQSQPVNEVVLLDAPSGFKYAEVTIDSGASTNSVLYGKNYSQGDVIVYPTVTVESSLPITIDGEGVITITRGGDLTSQTFSAYLWSAGSGGQQAITYQDPFYQATIGPFGNNTGSRLVSQTVYVVAVREDSDGKVTIPSYDPYNILDTVDLGQAQPVVLNSQGFGTFYADTPGTYYGEVVNADGSFQGKLGANGVVGVTVA